MNVLYFISFFAPVIGRAVIFHNDKSRKLIHFVVISSTDIFLYRAEISVF